MIGVADRVYEVADAGGTDLLGKVDDLPGF